MQDRRLLQDDNRGLGQGITDNLLTFNRFTLIFEKYQESCSQPVPSIEHPAGLMSLAGHLALNDLLYPIIALHPQTIIPFDLKPTFSPITSDFPVDLSIVSLRVIQIPDGAGKGVGMVLHREALNICYSDSAIQKRFLVSKTGEIDLRNFFTDFQDWTISDTPLTFTNVRQSRKSTTVNLCPHQILSLLFHKTES
jgi:alpha-mannosidase II